MTLSQTLHQASPLSEKHEDNANRNWTQHPPAPACLIFCEVRDIWADLGGFLCITSDNMLNRQIFNIFFDTPCHHIANSVLRKTFDKIFAGFTRPRVVDDREPSSHLVYVVWYQNPPLGRAAVGKKIKIKKIFYSDFWRFRGRRAR